MTQKRPIVVGMGINKSRRKTKALSIDFAVRGNRLAHGAYLGSFDGDVSLKWLAAEAVVDGGVSNE